MAATSEPVEKMSYEQALAELEEIIETLESAQPALEEALKLFERGQALSQRCTTLLEQADLRVRQLTGQELSTPAHLQEDEEA